MQKNINIKYYFCTGLSWWQTSTDLRNWSGNVLYILSVKEFLYNIFLSLILFWLRTSFRDSVSSFGIPCFRAAIFAIKMCIRIYRKILFRWSSSYVFIAKEIRHTCFTGICYQRNYRQHTKVRTVGSNSLLLETCKVM